MRERDEVAACEFGLKMRGSKSHEDTGHGGKVRRRSWNVGTELPGSARISSEDAGGSQNTRNGSRAPVDSPPPRLAARSQRRREAIEALDKLFNG